MLVKCDQPSSFARLPQSVLTDFLRGRTPRDTVPVSLCVAMSAVHIPREVLDAIRTVKDLYKLAGIAGTPEDAKTVQGSLSVLLGATGTTLALTIASLSAKEYAEIIDDWMIPGAGETTTTPTPIQRGQALLVGRAARLAAGVVDTPEPVQAQQAASSTTLTNVDMKKKVKLTAILSQHDETEITENISKASQYHSAYEVVFGPGEKPRPQLAPSLLQLAAIEYLLDAGVVPYVDFNVFGPYHHRIMRKIKLVGQMLSPDGTLTQVEIPGPPSFRHWLASFKLMVNAFIMTRLLFLGPLVTYHDIMGDAMVKYGEFVWPLLYQVDVRFRLELVERKGVEAEIAHQRAGGEGTLEPRKKWLQAWRDALADRDWWKQELEDNAIALALKLKNASDVIRGDALTARSSSEHVASAGVSDDVWSRVAGPTLTNPNDRKRRAVIEEEPPIRLKDAPPISDRSSLKRGSPPIIRDG